MFRPALAAAVLAVLALAWIPPHDPNGISP